MRNLLFVLPILALAACSASQTASVDGWVTKTVVAGQSFCAKATADGPLVVALADLSGVPVIVTDVASAVVAANCAAIGGIPVSPPANPASAPVVAIAPVVSVPVIVPPVVVPAPAPSVAKPAASA